MFQFWYVTPRLSAFVYRNFGTGSGLIFGGTQVFTCTRSWDPPNFLSSGWLAFSLCGIYTRRGTLHFNLHLVSNYSLLNSDICIFQFKNSEYDEFSTLRRGDADLRFYITTVQDAWRKSAFLTRACFTCTIHLIMQYIQPVSERSCWRMFIETWPHSELNFRHCASSI